MKEIYFSNSNEDNKDDIYFSISELLVLCSWTVSAVVGPELASTRTGEIRNTVVHNTVGVGVGIDIGNILDHCNY